MNRRENACLQEAIHETDTFGYTSLLGELAVADGEFALEAHWVFWGLEPERRDAGPCQSFLEIWQVKLGRFGCGRSTLMRLLNALARKTGVHGSPKVLSSYRLLLSW